MAHLRIIWQKNKSAVLYGASLALLLFFLKWLELRFIIFDHSLETYIGCIAVIFTILGIWLATKLSKPKIKTLVIEKEIYIPVKEETEEKEFVADAEMISRLQLSRREMDVLQLMARGFSNQEIASQIFVSLSTVKTHNQNLFEKLEVKRRIQAVEKAKALRLVP